MDAGAIGGHLGRTLLCLLELGLVPWVVLVALPFTLPLKTLHAWPQQAAGLLLGLAETDSGRGAQLLYRVRREDWRHLKNYFLTQL